MLAAKSGRGNAFFALRHGQSRANVRGVICSAPAVATLPEYGLSELGREQARQAGRDVLAALADGGFRGLCLLSSDYARARETAAAVRDAYLVAAHASGGDQPLPPLYQQQVILDQRLRERWFGDYDMQSDSHYRLVWEEDARDASHTLRNVESVDAVRRRAAELVAEYDAALRDHMVVFVAHGDVLQILQTAFLNLDARRHRSLEHLETAKLRRLTLES
jgi:probable phosphoglycerate mutase